MQRRAILALELKTLEHLDRGLAMPAEQPDMRATRERHRGAHFVADRGSEILAALLDLALDRAQQLEPNVAAGKLPLLECAPRGDDRLVDIGGAAERDMTDHLFGGWVLDLAGVGLDRIDPLAVDVEFGAIAHGDTPRMPP